MRALLRDITRPSRARRYSKLAMLLLKCRSADPKELTADLEALGPTFIKLGQLLSTRGDLLPQAHLEALSRLQDRVEPFPFSDVEAIIHVELGSRISKAFSEFDPKPLAAASLGQVHSAVLRSGRPVAVKVQRPNIQKQITEDLSALLEIAGFIDRNTKAGKRYEFHRMVEELRLSLLQELDYRHEARHLECLRQNLAEFRRIFVPAPVPDYSTSRVLTMDLVRGSKITTLGPVARMDLDGSALAEELFAAYLKQILVDGFFHADPHPGNVFITDEGNLALLDLGMVARISPGMQEKLLQLLLAISEGRGEDAAALAVSIGEECDDFDREGFARATTDFVVRHHDVTVEQAAVGRNILELSRLSADYGIRPPSELTLLGKTLLNLDQVGRVLDPGFQPNAAIRRNSVEIFRQRMTASLSPGNFFARLMEMKEFGERLPSRISRTLELLASNRLEMRIDAFDEVHLMEGLQKIANRITIGLILAALIVGAAMLMRVETNFRLFGYPGLAMICFLVAALGGLALSVNIFFFDEKRKPRKTPRSR